MVAFPKNHIRAQSEPRNPLKDSDKLVAYRDLLHALLKSGRCIVKQQPGGFALAITPGPRPSLAKQAPQSPIFKPRMDRWDEETNTVVAFELPGVLPSDLHINTRDGNLIVSGERRASPRNNAAHTNQNASSPDNWDPSSGGELRYGKFHRAVFIRPGLQSSHISATLKDGLLYVSFPRELHDTSLPSPEPETT